MLGAGFEQVLSVATNSKAFITIGRQLRQVGLLDDPRVTPESVISRVLLHGQPDAVPLSKVMVVGRCIKRIVVGNEPTELGFSECYDRQVRAFGREGQRKLNASPSCALSTPMA